MPVDLIGLIDAEFEEIAVKDLLDEGLRALADLASRDTYGGCNFVSSHRTSDGSTEAVVIDLYVELGQAERSHDIREHEHVAIVATTKRTMPTVYPLRYDFPQHLPHMNLNYLGKRRSLCLFDAAADDIAHIYNPAMLVERARWWMKKSAYGELHGIDQPLDPALAPAFWSLVLPRDFDASIDASYVALPQSKHPLAPVLLAPGDFDLQADVPLYSCDHLVTEPTNHGAMVDLPNNVAELIDIYAGLGVDLILKIKRLFSGDLNDPKLSARIRRGLLLVITTPLIGADDLVGAKTTRAFLNPKISMLDVAKALGIASDEGGAVGRLLAAAPDQDALKALELMPLNVVDGFTPELARACSGRTEMPNRKIAAIGLGALGSQSVLNLARMGQSCWRLIDQDFVAPHNLARHAAPGGAVGHSKAEVVAHEINELFLKREAVALHASIDGHNTKEALMEVLAHVERILDFSASIRAARWLSSHDGVEAPVSSYFVNPGGTALVALHEGPKRQGRGGIVEMAYYALLVADETLHSHLATSGLVRIGSCRDVSVTIPQSRMALLAGLSALDFDATNDLPSACVKIWSLAEDGAVSVRHQAVPAFCGVRLGEWTVMVAPDVVAKIEAARAQSNVETGGILLGGFDLESRTLFVTSALPNPSDSKAGRTYYERGTRGVQDAIKKAELITMRHVTYIGEWHTHPTGSSSQVSSLDRTLLGWISDLRQLFLMPGLLLILGDDGLRVALGKGSWAEDSLLQTPSCRHEPSDRFVIG